MKVETNPNKTNIEITSGQSCVKFNTREQTTEVMGLKSNVTGPSVEWELEAKEDKVNKTQTIGPESTSVQYPSAKCVYEALQNIPGTEQIQSDWTQTDDTQVDFIKHKPNLATVATSGSYTDLSDTPTKVSQFTNDEDYLQTDRGYEYFWHRADWNESDTGKLSYILNKPTIPVVPTNVSAFTNDAGYITLSDVPAQVQSDWNQSDNTQVDYIKNKPTIPAAQVNSDWNSSSGVSEILNKPTIPSVAQSITSGDTGYTTGDMVYQYILSLDGSQISY